jgi:hypothetical protein
MITRPLKMIFKTVLKMELYRTQSGSQREESRTRLRDFIEGVRRPRSRHMLDTRVPADV